MINHDSSAILHSERMVLASLYETAISENPPEILTRNRKGRPITKKYGELPKSLRKVVRHYYSKRQSERRKWISFPHQFK